MPWAPRPRCAQCHKIGCKSHRPKPFATSRPTRERRPEYDGDRPRRRAFVLAELNQVGVYLGDGMWQAACPLCRRVLTLPLREWWADHVVAVGSGGHEGGTLRLSCASCQRKQSGRVGRTKT